MRVIGRSYCASTRKYIFPMRAMVLEQTDPAASRPLRLAALAEPEPGPGELSIVVEACGVCRTDLHIVEGEVGARLPIVPGHQAAGCVVRLGPGVSGFSEGDAVGVGWL